MATLDEVLKRIKTLKPPRLAAGNEINDIDGRVSTLDVWALIEAVRICCQLPGEFQGILQRLGEFVVGPKPLAFTKLSRARLGIELLARVLNNKLVSQKEFGICGPAAIAMETAQNRPGDYIKMAIELAEEGETTLRDLVLKPNAYILNYHPAGSIPEADWMVCASIRNEPINLEKEFTKETYGGSGVAEVFEWMIKAGYRKVIAVDHQVFVANVYVHPAESRPPGIDAEDKIRAFNTMKDLRARGWLVLMCCKMTLMRGVESLKQAQDQEEEMAELVSASAAKDMTRRTMETVTTSLETPNPGRIGTLINVGKMLVSGSAGEGHWVYLEQLDPCKVDQSMFTVTICSHGQRHRAVNVPAAGFINKYTGFVAVTDLE